MRNKLDARIIRHMIKFEEDQFDPASLHGKTFSSTPHKNTGISSASARPALSTGSKTPELGFEGRSTNTRQEDAPKVVRMTLKELRLPIYSLCALIVIVCYPEGSRAIECFECNSHVDSRCADDQPPSSMKKPCHDLVDGSKYTLCRKIDQRVEFKVNGLPENERIIRSCGWDESRYKNQCYDRSGFGGVQRVCSCSTDNCNGAVHRSPTSFYVLGSSLLLAILARKIST